MAGGLETFSGPASNTWQPGGWRLCVRGGAEMPRNSPTAPSTGFVKDLRRQGLAWIKVNRIAKGRDGLQSPS